MFGPELTPSQIEKLQAIQDTFKKTQSTETFDEAINSVVDNPMKKIATSGLLLQLTPYLAFILIVGLIIGFVVICTKVSKVRNNPVISKARNGTLGLLGRILRAFKPILKMLQFDPSTKGMLRMLNPMAAKVPSTPRELISSGRCDNLSYKESSNGRNCDNTIKPDDILWEMDISKFPEYYSLPIAEQKKLEKRLKIYIPWEKNSSFYVPKCNKARFEGEREGSASKLLVDNGLTCKLAEFNSTTYNDMPTRASQTYS